MLLALSLGAIGLVLLRSAFVTPPDPRTVLADLIGGKGLGGSPESGGSGLALIRESSNYAGVPIAQISPYENPEIKQEIIAANEKSRNLPPEIRKGKPS